MTISRFQGRGNAGGVMTQNRNAPPYITQYSGRGSVGQGGQLYSVNNPGAKQTAKREPNKPVPSVDSKSDIQNNVIFYTVRSEQRFSGGMLSSQSLDFHISPWDLTYTIDDVPTEYIIRQPDHLVYGHNPANGHFIQVIPIQAYIDYLQYTGFIVLEFYRNTVKRTNSYDSFSPPGYEWAQDIMFGNNITIGTSDYLRKNNSLRYATYIDLSDASPKLQLKFGFSKGHYIYHPLSSSFIPGAQNYIDANGGSLVFTKTVAKPELPSPFNQPLKYEFDPLTSSGIFQYQSTSAWWGFAIK